MNKQLITIISLFAYLSCGIIFAQSNEDVKWAIGYTGSVFLKPILSDNTLGVSTGRGFSDFTVWGEYYLKQQWSVTAGYYRTEVGYGNTERTMEGLHVGARKYVLRPDLFVQPYVSVAPRINWGKHKEEHSYSAYRNEELILEGKSKFTNPRLSFLAGAGMEMYLFTSVAFIVEYNIGMGIGAKSYVEENSLHLSPSILKDRGFYHQVGLGVKVTFPFRINSDKGKALFDSILDLWINSDPYYPVK